MIIVQLDSEELGRLIQNAVKKGISELTSSLFPNEINKPLNIKQASEFLNLSVPSIYGLIHRKAIPVSKRGRRLFFNRKELTSWLENGRKLTIEEIQHSARK